MIRAELIFIPAPGAGHLLSTVEFAKLLAARDGLISISILMINMPSDSGTAAFTQHLQKDDLTRIAFIDIPPPDETIMKDLMSKSHPTFVNSFIESHRTQVRDVVAAILNRSESSKLAGFVIDMFCTVMVDVANEFNVPAYAFYTSGAGFLGLKFYVQSLKDNNNQEIYEYKDTDVQLPVPSFSNPVPSKVLPTVMLSKDVSPMVIATARRLRQTKAIVVNTVLELESHAIKSLADDKTIPRIYHVGPIINFKTGEDPASNHNSGAPIISWLDSQPPSSVVFLCFGSKGSFDVEQSMEIARALEQSGHRFLWSLRCPSQEMEHHDLPKDYADYGEVLPEGFLERTSLMGKVIGWAPQVTVLSHPAVGGFVSHCGWNSSLESIWCGVPMATWPMYAEQQINAFQLVKELGLAVEIKMDYRRGDLGVQSPVVTAEAIERGIRSLMDGETEMRKRVKEMKDICRMAVIEGGSSYTSIGQFIEDVISNIREKA